MPEPLVTDVDAAPSLVICRGNTVTAIQAALFEGWEYRTVTDVPLQLGMFVHPSGVPVPIYQFGKDFVKLAKPADIVAIEGDLIPPWAHLCNGIVTVTARSGSVLLTAHKVYAETGKLRVWIHQLKTLPAEVPA